MVIVKRAVILCGGLATRFLPITKTVCKEMLPILNKPIIDVLVSELKEAGIEEVLMVVGRNKEILENYFDRNVEIEERLKQTGKTELLKSLERTHNILNLTFIRQIEARGTGYATLLAKKFAHNEPFLLLFGDEIVFAKKSATKQLLEAYEKTGKSTIAVQKVPVKELNKYGIISPKSEITSGLFEISGIVEKPCVEDAPSKFSYIGLAVLESNIFEEIEKIEVPQGVEIGVTTAYNALAKKTNFFAANISGKRFDVGASIGLIKANVYAAKKDKFLKNELDEFLKKQKFS